MTVYSRLWTRRAMFGTERRLSLLLDRRIFTQIFQAMRKSVPSACEHCPFGFVDRNMQITEADLNNQIPLSILPRLRRPRSLQYRRTCRTIYYSSSACYSFCRERGPTEFFGNNLHPWLGRTECPALIHTEHRRPEI